RSKRDWSSDVCSSDLSPVRVGASAFRSRIADAPTRTGEARPELAEAWRLVLASRGRLTVEELGRRVMLSPRQLRSEFTREFGIEIGRAECRVRAWRGE